MNNTRAALTALTAALLLLVAGVLAAVHPAVRASRIDPIDAIRAE